MIGAPKCGTTAMASYLSEHPEVCVSDPKEPNYLGTDLRGIWSVESDADYRRIFRKRAAPVRIDASIWYLYSDDAVANILARRPDARFIVMLRNPVTMLPSLHRQLVNVLEEDVTEFEEAWRLSSARAAGRELPPGCRAPKTLIYTRTAAFGAQLTRLFSRVSPERVLVLFQEELGADPARAYRRILDFIGVDDDDRSTFEVINEARGFRSRAVKALVKRDQPFLRKVGGPIKQRLGVRSLGLRRVLASLNTAAPDGRIPSAALRSEIAQAYADDMRLLADMLGRDLATEVGWPLRRAMIA
jgi:hypothetical protein